MMSSDHPPIYPDEYGDWAAANRGAVVRDVPRRSRMEQWAPAERAIYDALLIVEKMPADVRLTDAVTLLGAAMNSVADYIDGFAVRRFVEELKQ